jgi:hypothetical protein
MTYDAGSICAQSHSYALFSSVPSIVTSDIAPEFATELCLANVTSPLQFPPVSNEGVSLQ